MRRITTAAAAHPIRSWQRPCDGIFRRQHGLPLPTPPNPLLVLDGTLIANAQPTGDVCFATVKQTVQISGTNIGDLLNEKGLSWGSFESGFNLQKVKPNGTTGCKRSHTNPVSGMIIADYSGQYTPFQYYHQTRNPAHTRPANVSEIGHSGPANHEYDLDDLLDAAKADNLPAMSYVSFMSFQAATLHRSGRALDGGDRGWPG
jgi:hypothetical protein